ncbi:MAG: glycosyltransferase involved in cell wall biosynthesis, partial [Chlamydiales bacterium]
MRFSIITITFNSEKFLEYTLQSIAEQDFTDYEHLIWDGGSTDKTLEIARSFPHVKIYEGKDKGISDAMNKGGMLAQGEFLLHLHSDDLLAHPTVLSKVDTFFRQHPQSSWGYGQAEIINSKGKLT